MKRRVVITGVGLVTPIGNDTLETWRSLLEGRSGVEPITHFDASQFPTRFAAEIRNFDPQLYIEKKEIKKMDTFSHFALAASEHAMRDAGLTGWDGVEAERAGVVVGSGIGGFGSIETEHATLLAQGPRRISPFFIPSSIVNLAAGRVSIRYGARGPNCAPCTACSAGTHAIGDAYRIVERGDADVMIAGGAEAAITPLSLAGFGAMKALSTRNEDPAHASRPFDRDRDGFVLGEGAGILILEELEHAMRRGAKVYAELAGYGMTSDAFHITAPSPGGDGAIRAMRRTLEDRGVPTDQVDYINAHGTSTPPNDRTETAAIRAVFGEHAYKLAISSTKSMIGHLLGAAGAVEVAVTALSVHDQIIHPTLNLENQDPECDLDYVPSKARRAHIRYALSNSFGFGGTNACIVLKHFEG